MAKASINIQSSKIFAFLHNNREAIISYLIDDKSRNDYDRTTGEAFNYYLKLLKEATSNYTKRTRQRIQTDKKKFLWEAIVNLNENHTLEDLKKLAVVLEKTYGWRSVQNTIHRDEGHVDLESGKKIYNYHGHIVLFMLDKNGIYKFKKRDHGYKVMEQLQTLNADVLNMERGISKKITKRVRMEHPQYRQYIQKITKIEIAYEQQNNELNILRLEISKLKKNKKKTAAKIRKYNRTNDDEWQKFRLLSINLLHGLFKDTSKYPLLYSNELSESDLLFEWIKAVKIKITSLEEENLMLSNMFMNLNEESSQESEEYNNMDSPDDGDEINVMNEYIADEKVLDDDYDLYEDDENIEIDLEYEDFMYENPELNYDEMSSLQINNSEVDSVEVEKNLVVDEQANTLIENQNEDIKEEMDDENKAPPKLEFEEMNDNELLLEFQNDSTLQAMFDKDQREEIHSLLIEKANDQSNKLNHHKKSEESKIIIKNDQQSPMR